MSAKLTQKQIGRRLSQIRKMKGLSQEELAKDLKISRSALTQIELGNRGVDVLEFQRLSVLLGFSLDDFVSKNFNLKEAGGSFENEAFNVVQERDATPYFQSGKFKNVLLYILEKCAGKPNVGETVLYKLLYFSDFNYYEQYEEHLTGAKYRKLPFGPVPQRIDSVISQMIEKKMIQRIRTEYYKKSQTRFIPLVKADLTQLKASEKEVIDRVIDQMSDWSAATISDYSHKDMPWLASKEGDEISYELVFYREPPFSVRNYATESDES
jgi:transcriptional regulator with XRE-family HTH domain